MNRRRLLQGAVVLALAALGYGLDLDLSGGPRSGGVATSRTDVRASGASEISDAFESRRSGFMTDQRGVVAKSLPDDEKGSRHQRFILRLDGGRTLLVAHNIDLAARVPLAEGDTVEVRGQYEWNERGGVLHWTHRDPDGSHPGGFIRHESRQYD